ncbi:MAG: divalent metal cation transporter [Pseudonocardiales bacterium]|nr:divalent metal cation transporter [Pseudonocardiales bacterium]
MSPPAEPGPGGSAAIAPVLTVEDAARSRDRGRVYRARGAGRRWYLMWLLAGPGMLAMLAENDGPSMVSYAAAGAAYGLGFFLPFIVVTFAMAVVCQEMCMRVGAVTHRGYGQLVLQRFGPVWGWFAAGDLLFTNLVMLVGEFVVIRVGLAYFGIGAEVAAGLGVVLVVFTLSGGRYWRWERIVLGMAVFNGLFAAAGVMVGPRWSAVGHSMATFSPWPGGSVNTLLLLIASTIGATVTPWMVFFQQSASADKGMTRRDIRHGRLDTIIGGALAAVLGCGAFLAGTALVTRGGGIQGLAGAGFPGALSRVAGHAVGACSRWG